MGILILTNGRKKAFLFICFLLVFFLEIGLHSTIFLFFGQRICIYTKRPSNIKAQYFAMLAQPATTLLISATRSNIHKNDIKKVSSFKAKEKYVSRLACFSQR